MRRSVLVLWTIACMLATPALAEDGTGAATDEERRSKVVATVGTTTITVGDIQDMVDARSPYARKRLAKESALRQLLDNQVQNELFYQGAQKWGYEDDPEVRRAVNQTLVKVFVRKDFEETVTPDDVPQDQVEKYYEEHAEEFHRPEMRRARHILVGSKEEAEGLLEILETDPTQTFRALAKKRSLDTETNVRGGDLLYFTADGTVVGREASGVIDGTLAKAAFALSEKGDLSEPLDLGDGKWSVLELTGIRPEQVRTLDKAAARIRATLWREEREAALESLISRLREELKPEVHGERISWIVLDTPGEPATPQAPEDP